jgi:hypothetical protein
VQDLEDRKQRLLGSGASAIRTIRDLKTRPLPFDGAARMVSPDRISERMTLQQIGIRWWWPG